MDSWSWASLNRQKFYTASSKVYIFFTNAQDFAFSAKCGWDVIEINQSSHIDFNGDPKAYMLYQ